VSIIVVVPSEGFEMQVSRPDIVTKVRRTCGRSEAL